MNPLSFLNALQPVNWPILVLVTARVSGLMLTAPLWSLTTIPATLRGSIAIVLSLALLPAVPTVTVPVDGIAIMVPLFTELLVGIAIGISANVFLAAVAMASEVIALQMGLSLGAALGGMADLGGAGVGQLQGQFALTMYVVVGGPLALVAALDRSFQAIPPGHEIAMANGGRALLGVIGQVFPLAMQVVAPVMVALLLANVGMAILNRAVPQLNTMMVAVPLTVGVGFIALGLTLPFTATFIEQWAMTVGPHADDVVRALTPVLVH
ncbi:MAG TPA: flagellar biosynthetic protein FliR [Gemmatimonadales bacterium]|jgi:flagellar biosynthetic protein FliR